MVAVRMSAMNKSAFLEVVRGNLGGTATRKAAEFATAAVLDAIAGGLKQDGSVQILGFGTFSRKMRAARSVRNPKSGEVIDLPEMPSVSFRASSMLKS